MLGQCALCDKGTGTGVWPHDRDWYPAHKDVLMRIHFPYTCGVGAGVRDGEWVYPQSHFDRLEADEKERDEYEIQRATLPGVAADEGS